MKIFLYFISIPFLLFTCAGNTTIADESSLQQDSVFIPGNSIQTRFALPDSFVRVKSDSASFASYLRNFKLQSQGSKVYLYNGAEKGNQSVVAAVLDIDVGKKDLQQCADGVMRLRAEYLYRTKQYSKIHFNFTNGFRADYVKWAEGNRIKVNGNSTTWYAAAEKSYSYDVFKKYLEIVFSYAGTLSLSKELKAVSLDSIEVGDVFIYGGSPGHAVIVVDVAQHQRTQKRIFMIAQSYMPAQNIHVLKNLNDASISPWYKINESDKLYSPEWTFESRSLKRFR